SPSSWATAAAFCFFCLRRATRPAPRGRSAMSSERTDVEKRCQTRVAHMRLRDVRQSITKIPAPQVSGGVKQKFQNRPVLRLLSQMSEGREDPGADDGNGVLYSASILVAAVASLLPGTQMQRFKDSMVVGGLQLVFFWLLGRRCGTCLVQNWKHLPIPTAADGTTFAVLSALRSSIDGFGAPLASALFLGVQSWMGMAQQPFLSWAPALRDASLLLLMSRLLTAAQRAAELLYSSRILSTQRSELWQNTRERRVLACLLARAADLTNVEAEVPAMEPLDEQAPLAFERACAELITSGSPGSGLWQSMAKIADQSDDEDSDSTVSEELSPSRRGSADVLRREGIQCEPQTRVAVGAAALFRQLAVEGRLSYQQLPGQGNYTMSHPESWQEQITCGVYPTSQPGGGVVVTMESFPSQGLRWRVSATHQLSKLHVAQVRSDASLLLTELLEEAVKLGIEWPEATERGSVAQPATC
ncbi:unnamed protein product, partial [Effrenium voratum]